MEPSLSEQMKDAGLEQCSLCARWEPEADILRVEVDEPLCRQPVCPECLATLERVA